MMNGEIVYKDYFATAITGIVQADYRLDGRVEIICTSAGPPIDSTAALLLLFLLLAARLVRMCAGRSARGRCSRCRQMEKCGAICRQTRQRARQQSRAPA